MKRKDFYSSPIFELETICNEQMLCASDVSAPEIPTYTTEEW